MSDLDQLRAAAERAIEYGDVAAATALYRRILRLHPLTSEAADAVYYLMSGYRRPAQRAEPSQQADAKRRRAR
jgi:hypothetical protein